MTLTSSSTVHSATAPTPRSTSTEYCSELVTGKKMNLVPIPIVKINAISRFPGIREIKKI